MKIKVLLASPGFILVTIAVLTLSNFRNVDLIAILDKDTRRVVWSWGSTILEFPHYPVMLKNGNILVFDNGVRRTYSRVLEMEPVSGKVVWEYRGAPPKSFYSSRQGSIQRLPNGNTLICESYKGHVFEITPRKEIVWEFWNPIIRDRKQKTIYRFLRLPEDEARILLKMKKP